MREYGKVFCAVWESETFRALTDDGKLLAIYLMTCSHSTIAGVFRLPDGYVAEDMAWEVTRIHRAFGDLEANGFAVRCATTRWVWVVKHLDWNPPENPNQRKAAAKVANGIAAGCVWLPRFLAACGEVLGLRPDAAPAPDAPDKGGSKPGGGGQGGAAPTPAPDGGQPPAPPQAPAEAAAGPPSATLPEPLPNGSATLTYPQINPSGTVPKGFRNQEQEQEQEQYTEDYTERGVSSVDNLPDPSPYGATWALLHSLGIVGASPHDALLRSWVDKGVTADEWRFAAAAAAQKRKASFAYVEGVVRNRREEAALVAQKPGGPVPGGAVVPPSETVEEYLAKVQARVAAERRTPEQIARSEAAARAAIDRLPPTMRRRLKGAARCVA